MRELLIQDVAGFETPKSGDSGGGGDSAKRFERSTLTNSVAQFVRDRHSSSCDVYPEKT